MIQRLKAVFLIAGMLPFPTGLDAGFGDRDCSFGSTGTEVLP